MFLKMQIKWDTVGIKAMVLVLVFLLNYDKAAVIPVCH